MNNWAFEAFALTLIRFTEKHLDLTRNEPREVFVVIISEKWLSRIMRVIPTAKKSAEFECFFWNIILYFIDNKMVFINKIVQILASHN